MKVATGNGIALFAAIAAFFMFTTSEASHADLNITGSDGKVVLADVDREKIPELVNLLGSPDYQVWKQAQEYLASFGPDSIPELLKALERGGAEEKILSTFY